MEALEMEKEKFVKELAHLNQIFAHVKKFNLYENVKEHATQTNQLKHPCGREAWPLGLPTLR